jgi:hypothetical protein
VTPEQSTEEDVDLGPPLHAEDGVMLLATETVLLALRAVLIDLIQHSTKIELAASQHNCATE